MCLLPFGLVFACSLSLREKEKEKYYGILVDVD
jgi:hypothetical protein